MKKESNPNSSYFTGHIAQPNEWYASWDRQHEASTAQQRELADSGDWTTETNRRQSARRHRHVEAKHHRYAIESRIRRRIVGRSRWFREEGEKTNAFVSDQKGICALAIDNILAPRKSLTWDSAKSRVPQVNINHNSFGVFFALRASRANIWTIFFIVCLMSGVNRCRLGKNRRRGWVMRKVRRIFRCSEIDDDLPRLPVLFTFAAAAIINELGKKTAVEFRDEGDATSWCADDGWADIYHGIQSWMFRAVLLKEIICSQFEYFMLKSAKSFHLSKVRLTWVSWIIPLHIMIHILLTCQD